MKLNEAVRQLRKESGDTWQSFAWRHRMALTTVANYESGRMRPRTGKLIRFYLLADEIQSETAAIFLDAICQDVGGRIKIMGSHAAS